MKTTDEAAPESRVPGTAAENARMPELDGIRGIAIAMVLATHFFSYSMLGRVWTGFGKLILQTTLAGWLGVDLFFVLSGFLITGILFDSKRDPHYFRDFYARRALRILPLYWLVLAYLLVFRQDSGPFVVCGLLMVVNMIGMFGIAAAPGGDSLWSLAVEEHFYLIWPWVIRNSSLITALAISGSICVAEPLVRAYWRSSVSDVYYYSWFRFDGLAWGALVALVVRSKWGSRRLALRVAYGGAGLALLAGLIGARSGVWHRNHPLGAALQFSIPEMLFACVLLWVVTMAGSRYAAPFRWSVLRLFGDLSYCLYVIHMIVMFEFDALLGRFLNVSAAIGSVPFLFARATAILAISIGIALVSRRFFELPILKLKRHFQPVAQHLRQPVG